MKTKAVPFILMLQFLMLFQAVAVNAVFEESEEDSLSVSPISYDLGKQTNQDAAQTNTPLQPHVAPAKNVIYGSAGFLGLGGSASINYERLVFSIQKKAHIDAYIHGSYGAYSVWYSSGNFFDVSLQWLWGKKNSHLEVGLGLLVMGDEYFDGSTWTDKQKFELNDYPFANVGYRYQKPGGSLVFRTGIGVPDGIYISLGWAF